MELWTEKYRPSSLDGFLGNRKAAEGALEFVQRFRKGKALLLSGPPGVGKTLLPRLVAGRLGLHLIEISAADDRGKEDIETYFAASRTGTLFSKGKLIVIDEVDGLAGGDRGAIPALVELVKTSAHPVILIANDPWHPRLRPLKTYTVPLRFTKIPTPSLEKFLRTVCEKEAIDVTGTALKSLARFSNGDLRAALTDLQTVCRGRPRVGDGDLDAVGFRERESGIHDILPSIFRSGRIGSSRKLIFEGDKDPDEVLWWIESNAHLEFPADRLPAVFAALAQADRFRGLVARQQNWAFKGYMVDLMAGVTVHRTGEAGYVAYRPPDRLVRLGRTKAQRQAVKDMCRRLGKELHCSTGRVRRDYLPYLRILASEGKPIGLEPEDSDLILGHAT